jgi:hypothetical protein
MKTLVFALLSMPLLSWAASASTTYTFTVNTVRGPIGFTYIAPEPLAQSSNYVSSWTFAGCNTSGAPGWICLDAYLRQTTVNGVPIVQVTLDILNPAELGDAFAMDELTESFSGASLDSAGSYQGFLSDATFTVTMSPDPSSAQLEVPNSGPGVE